MRFERMWLLSLVISITGCSSNPDARGISLGPDGGTDQMGSPSTSGDDAGGTSTPGMPGGRDGGASSPGGGGTPGATADAGGQGPTGSGETPASLPTASGTCPEFKSGSVSFAPAGIKARNVTLSVGDSGGGPLVFYWHGTGSSPQEAQFGLSAAVVKAITAMGGVVAAPSSDPDAGTYPWFLVGSTREDDLLLADEIVACAIAKKNIDTSHIHTIGMSAGGLQSSQMGIRRSSYLASIGVYSGGLGGGRPTFQDASNKFAALMFFGGANDTVVISFKTATENYVKLLDGEGHSTVVCDHGGGHSIPSGGGAAAWRFFQDHPFGTNPTPYDSAGLPSDFPSYCAL